MSGIWAESPFRAAISVAATEYPVSYAEAKLHCRIDDDVEKTWVENAIKACTEKASTLLGGKQLCSATRILYLSAFPIGRQIAIPYPPLTAISSIAYVDTAGASQTWASAQYQVDIVSTPGRVVLHPDYSWPSTQAGILNAVTITFTCGYGAASAVPFCVKHGILAGVSFLYENRGDEAGQFATVGVMEQVSKAIQPFLESEIMMVA